MFQLNTYREIYVLQVSKRPCLLLICNRTIRSYLSHCSAMATAQKFPKSTKDSPKVLDKWSKVQRCQINLETNLLFYPIQNQRKYFQNGKIFKIYKPRKVRITYKINLFVTIRKLLKRKSDSMKMIPSYEHMMRQRSPIIHKIKRKMCQIHVLIHQPILEERREMSQ